MEYLANPIEIQSINPTYAIVLLAGVRDALPYSHQMTEIIIIIIIMLHGCVDKLISRNIPNLNVTRRTKGMSFVRFKGLFSLAVEIYTFTNIYQPLRQYRPWSKKVYFPLGLRT